MHNADSAAAFEGSYRQLARTVPMTRYDWGWVILCIGMAIGGAMVFMPIQIGLKGLWVFMIAAAIAYPGVYLLQDIFLKSLSETDAAEDYTGIITQYLGKNWGIILTVFYFLLIATGMMSYSIAVTRDSASYLQTYGVTESPLSDTFWWPLLLMIVLTGIAARGERLLFKISGPMVIFKLGIIVMLGLIMVPFWNFSNIMTLPAMGPLVRDVLLTIPFAVFSIIFMPILSPMNIAFRKEGGNRQTATFRAIRASRVAFLILVTSVLFFAVSFTLSLSHEQAVEAYTQNISALALAAKVLPGVTVQVLTTLLNLFAVVTAFFALYLGFHESLQGIVLNILYRRMPEEKVNKKLVHVLVTLGITFGLWGWILLNAKVLFILQLSGPLFGVVSCFIPCYLVYKIPSLFHLKGLGTAYVILFGVILFLSPFLKFFE